MTRVLVSAASMSTGKTTLAAGIGAALVERGLTVQAFKKGPDYIDPMWLTAATGRPCFNLDYHTMSTAEIRASFAHHTDGANIAMIEGNMGLFDGVDLAGADSNAALAALLKTPVVLVLDATGMTRGVAPLIRGYQAFDSTISITGVILNKVGGDRHESKLRRTIERYTDMAVIGAVHRQPALEISERHLGLITSNEATDAEAKIAGIAKVVSDQVDLDRVLDIAASAPPMAPPPRTTTATPRAPDLRIAIARDSAFGFYYADDLGALRSAGAELLPFDTTADARLPEADGLFIGGGFPECHLAALEANAALRGEIRAAIEGGMPAYAECGGLAYLSRSLSWRGETGEMVGVVPADTVVHERPQGRGYTRLRETGAGLWPAHDNKGGLAEIAAHEFHYASLDTITGAPVYAYEMLRGVGIDGHNDGIVYKNLLAGFAHRRDVAADRWARRFVEFVRRCKTSSGCTEPRR